MTRPFIKDLQIGMKVAGEVFLLAESSLDETTPSRVSLQVEGHAWHLLWSTFGHWRN